MSPKSWTRILCLPCKELRKSFFIPFQSGFISFFWLFISTFAFSNNIPWTSAELLPSTFLPCQENAKIATFHQVSSFDFENASLFLAASWLAHRPSEYDRSLQLKSWGFEQARDLPRDKSGARGYLADHGDFLLLVFRGSESKEDYKSNAAFYQSPAPDFLKVPGGWIHDGIKTTYRQLRAELLKSYQDFGGKSKPLYITGHSRGGALAVLAALDFANQGGKIGSIYTFGQPKIGNPIVANRVSSLFREKFHRIFIESDITPRVPPAKETAQNFSKILSANQPKLRKAVENTFTTLNYAVESGRSQFLTKEGNILPLGSQELEFEHSYWKKVSSILYDQTDIQMALNFIASRFLDHDPKVYVCALAKHFQN